MFSSRGHVTSRPSLDLPFLLLFNKMQRSIAMTLSNPRSRSHAVSRPSGSRPATTTSANTARDPRMAGPKDRATRPSRPVPRGATEARRRARAGNAARTGGTRLRRHPQVRLHPAAQEARGNLSATRADGGIGPRPPSRSDRPTPLPRSSICTSTRTSRSSTAAAASRSWSPGRPSWGSRRWRSPITTVSTAPSASPRPAPSGTSSPSSGPR